MLSSLLTSERWRDNRTFDSEGRLFIDRDGHVFREIFNYLRDGTVVLKYVKDEADLQRLRSEADYFGLQMLKDAIDEGVDDNLVAKQGHGIPITLNKSSWARVRGKVGQDGGEYSSWQWLEQSGNLSLLSPGKSSGELCVGETGTYLMLFRLGMVPRHFDPYPAFEHENEFAEVLVQRRVAAPDSIGRSSSIVLARFGVFDTRRDQDAVVTQPNFVSGGFADVVTLLEGDIVSSVYPSGLDIFEVRHLPLPPDTPPKLFQSITLIKLDGTSVARFVREPSGFNHERPSAGNNWKLTNAAWSRTGLIETPFSPILSSNRTTVEFPAKGTYLVLGRTAVCGYGPSMEDRAPDDFVEHAARFRVMLSSGHLLHENHSVCMQASARSYDREEVAEHGAFHDVVGVTKGCTMEFMTDGNVILHNHGTKGGHDCPSQYLNIMLLSSSMEMDRYCLNMKKRDGQEQDEEELLWEWHWERALSPIGGSEQPTSPLLSSEGQSLITIEKQTLLVLASFPPFKSDDCRMALTVNDEMVAVSQTLQNSGHVHTFHEVLEVDRGDKIFFSRLRLDDDDRWESLSLS